MKQQIKIALLFVCLVLVALLVMGAQGVPKSVFDWIVTKRLSVTTGGSDFQSNMIITVPTAQATATPGLIIKQSGLGNALEVRNASNTPVAYINRSGNFTAGGIYSGGGTVGADTVISGALTVSSTSSMNGALNMNNYAINNIGNAGTDFGSDGSLTTAKAITITSGDLTLSSGNADVSGTFNYGSDNLYPLGYASTGYQIVCGATGVFTGSTVVTATGLTTITQVLLTQITAPITTAAYIHSSQATTTTFTATSLDSTFGAGTTGVNAYYCAVGNQ